MMPEIEKAREVRLVMGETGAGTFMTILQGGFIVKCKTGVTVEGLLREDFGITREYMERRLSTVFLDGQCIDDIENTIIGTGSTLALSSAMPGLAGATLRRKGLLASMRGSITRHEDSRRTGPAEEGFITVKLFNVLAAEIGAAFMTRGIYVEASDLAGFFGMRGKAFWSNVREVYADGQPVSREVLETTLGRKNAGLVYLVADWNAVRP